MSKHRMNRPVYAWMTWLPDGRWNLVGVRTPEGHLPLISHDRQVMERYREYAISHGKTLKQPVQFVSYSAIEVLEHFFPEKDHATRQET